MNFITKILYLGKTYLHARLVSSQKTMEINPGNEDIDTVINATTDNAIVVEGSTGRTGMGGITAPDLKLHIKGGRWPGGEGSEIGTIKVEDLDGRKMIIGAAGLWRDDLAADNGNIVINEIGYNTSYDYFRDLRVKNGKQADVFVVDGSAASVAIGFNLDSDPPLSTLCVNGGVNIGGVGAVGANNLGVAGYISMPYTKITGLENVLQVQYLTNNHTALGIVPGGATKQSQLRIYAGDAFNYAMIVGDAGGTDLSINDYAAYNRIKILAASIVINEDAYNFDFRVEGDTDANLFFVDASADFVAIGKNNPGTKLDVNGVITATGGNSGNWNTAYGWGNHASAGYVTNPLLSNEFKYTHASHELDFQNTADNITILGIAPGGASQQAVLRIYSGGSIHDSGSFAQIVGTAIGKAANGFIDFNGYSGLTQMRFFCIDDANFETIFNAENQNTVDFRVKGGSDSNLLFIDSSANIACFGTATPVSGSKVTISGALSVAESICVPMVADETIAIGDILYISQSGTSGRVSKCPASNEMPVGIAKTAGNAAATILVCVAGICQVLFKTGVTPTMGYVAYTSDEAGHADCASTVPVAATHFREVGHIIESGSSGGLARCFIHFN
jgi:hypothetical protein